MKYTLKFLLIIWICFFLCSCQSTDSMAVERQALSIDEHGVIHFVGETSLANAAELERLLQSDSSLTLLNITSAGGDVFGGIRIGELVSAYKLKVKVTGICASSCANYIITASEDVTIAEHALLGWHGGATQPYYTAFDYDWLSRIWLFLTNNNDTVFKCKWLQAETSFFESKQADQIVTIIGMTDEFNDARNAPLFSYDHETLSKLGLSVHFENEINLLDAQGNKLIQLLRVDDSNIKRIKKNHSVVVSDGLKRCNEILKKEELKRT